MKKKPDRKLLLVLGLVVGAAWAAAGPPPQRQVQGSKPALKLGALEKTSQPGAS